MKLKRYILGAGLAASIFSLGSCKKTTFENPYSSLSPEDAFKTPARIEKAAVGMYDQLQNADFLGGRVLIYADIRGIDCGVPSFFGNMPQFNTLLSTDGTTSAAWTGAYRSIYEVNNFLKNLSEHPGVISDEETAQFIGEGEFIRSLNYFYLVNLWGKPYNFTADHSHLGVPIILEPAADPFAASNQVPRNTVGEVYAQMEKDLLDAETKLPDSDPAANDFDHAARATKGAAQALLMRIYLYEGDYTKALTYANKVIAAGYQLDTDPTAPFSSTPDAEYIFYVGMNGADNPNTNNALGQHYSPYLRADISISPAYVALMGATDQRRTKLTTVVDGANYTTKYTTVSDWVPILRFSEVMLTKAEALAEQATGVSTEALDLVNQVRARSSALPVAAATKQDLINAIWNERRIELAFEGQGEFEFQRTKRDIPAHNTVATQPWASDYTVLPIPKTETDANPKLEQNHPY